MTLTDSVPCEMCEYLNRLSGLQQREWLKHVKMYHPTDGQEVLNKQPRAEASGATT